MEGWAACGEPPVNVDLPIPVACKGEVGWRCNLVSVLPSPAAAAHTCKLSLMSPAVQDPVISLRENSPPHNVMLCRLLQVDAVADIVTAWANDSGVMHQWLPAVQSHCKTIFSSCRQCSSWCS